MGGIGRGGSAVARRVSGFRCKNIFNNWRGGRVAEGAPLLREYMVYPVSRVRIPLSPPINKYRVNDPVFVYYWMVRTREEG